MPSCPRALARWLSDNGHDAQHVSDYSIENVSDMVIWEKARMLKATIITKDEDFLHISHRFSGPAIVWITCGNTRRVALLARMAVVLPEILSALENGERVVEVR